MKISSPTNWAVCWAGKHTAAEAPKCVRHVNNRTGRDVGAQSLYNNYFGPKRYEVLEQTEDWQDAQSSYTAWREGDNETITTCSPRLAWTSSPST